MKKNCVISLFIFLTIYSCKKEREEETIYSFETVVDSSFYCSFNTNSEHYKLNNVEPNSYFVSHIANDSLIVGFDFNFRISDQFMFTLAISKSFYSKGFKYNYEGNFNRILSNKEFISIFKKDQLFYAYFSNNSACDFCDSTGGVSIKFKEWHTKYTTKHVPNESLTSFYSNCNFQISDIQILDSANLVIKGQFNVKIFKNYAYNSDDYQWLSGGYFKCYAKNLMKHQIISAE